MAESLFDSLNREIDPDYVSEDELALNRLAASESEETTPTTHTSTRRAGFIESRISGGREKVIQALRHADWYRDCLLKISFSVEELAFSVKNPANKTPLEDLLASYGKHLVEVEANPDSDPELDRSILKLELRHLTKDCNRRLSEIMSYRFTGHHDYKHKRSCPYSEEDDDYTYSSLDYNKPLGYKDSPAILIVNSVGCQALFGAPSSEIVKSVFQKGFEAHERPPKEEIDKTNLYDILPVQHLIARIWSVNGLRRFLIQHPEADLGKTVKHFETLNRHARHALKRPRVCRADTLYVSMYYDVRTVREAEDHLLAHQRGLATLN